MYAAAMSWDRVEQASLRATSAAGADRQAYAALFGFCLATVLLVPLERFVLGLPAWGLTWLPLLGSATPRLRRNLGVLHVVVLMLAFAPIHTGLDTRHFMTLGTMFLLAVLGPYLWLRWRAQHELDWRFFPRHLAARDLLYTFVSIPLAWAIIEVYFFMLSADVAANWNLPQPHDPEAVKRLVIGINCVGIWDELFFINTVYVLLRRIFPARLANLAQAVVYTSVLWDMAFRGWGPPIVYGFALTQGVMYEKSGVLLWVILVHLIVDVFLVLAILQYHYPGQSLGVF